MAVRVSGEGARRVLFDRRARAAVRCRRAAEIERASDAAQAGARGRAALLAQAQVVAWVRVKGDGPGRFVGWAECTILK